MCESECGFFNIPGGVDFCFIYLTVPFWLFLQEIFAYEEAKPLNPELCSKMQINIIDALLKDVYVTEDKCLQRGRLLIMKARVLRSCGTERLSNCIQCLSLAISAVVSFMISSRFLLNWLIVLLLD